MMQKMSKIRQVTGVCSFISSSSKLEPDSPFDRKPMTLFQKVGGCKSRKTSGLLRDNSSKCML